MPYEDKDNHAMTSTPTSTYGLTARTMKQACLSF